MNSKSAKSRPLKARKIWRNLEATGLIAFGSLAGCSGEGNEHRAASDADATQVVEGSTGIGEGAGEGEGAINSALTAGDDVAYLTQLGLMRGHLWVGHQLYQNNLHGMAITHMKHPKAELYSSLKEPFDIRRVDGFAAELETLANSVENKKPAVEVEQAYVALTSAIKRTELGADTMSPGLVGEVIVALLRTAGEEYAIGVVDGKINNLHEYQDAWALPKSLVSGHAAQLSPTIAKPLQPLHESSRFLLTWKQCGPHSTQKVLCLTKQLSCLVPQRASRLRLSACSSKAQLRSLQPRSYVPGWKVAQSCLDRMAVTGCNSRPAWRERCAYRWSGLALHHESWPPLRA